MKLYNRNIRLAQGKLTVRQLKDLLNTVKDEQTIAVEMENGQLYAVDSVDVVNSASGPMAVIRTGVLLGSSGPSGSGEGSF